MRATRVLVGLAALLAGPPAASAGPEAGSAAAATPEPDAAKATGSVGSVGASIIPGVLVHGAGLWVAGDRRTAHRLLVVEGVGLSLAGIGGAALAVSGGSRRLSTLTIPLIVSGSGLFVLGWLADIYGSASGGRREAGARRRAALELELGAIALHDPVFDYGAFTSAAATARIGRWRLSPELLVSVDDDNQRLRGEVAYAIAPPGPGDGSRLEVVGGSRFHRYGGDDFTAFTIEAMVSGRLDLSRVGESLSGSFTTLGAGLGLEVIDYAVAGASTDVSDMLLGRFGFGVYLGGPASLARGEIELYYDHRRDDLVGGLSPGQRGSGFAGYFGAALDLDLGGRWGLAGRGEIGSAALIAAALRYRFGGRP